MKKYLTLTFATAILIGSGLQSCRPPKKGPAVDEDAARKAYVAPGEYDEFYNFVSGGFNGQVAVYGYLRDAC